MNLKAFITTIVLGSSSLAFANPSLSDSRERVPSYAPARHTVAQYRPVWTGSHQLNSRMEGTDSVYIGWMANGHQLRRFGNRLVHDQSWFDMTEPTRIVGSGHREIFHVGAYRGEFRALRLVALGSGSTNINNIKIEFADGTKQTLLVKQKLDRTNPTIAIDLAGKYRSISRILVYGLSGDGAAYKLQAL
jgi:hypothetical protein